MSQELLGDKTSQELHAKDSSLNTGRLDPEHCQRVSQPLQTNELKTEKQKKANGSMHSALLKRVSVLNEPRRHISCIIEAFREKGPAGGERKAKKQATKPAAKRSPNKRHKPSQGSLAAARYMNAEKTSQEAAAFYSDSCAEEAQTKRKCHWALDKKKEIKVRGVHIFEDITETVREEAANVGSMH
ncbi:hypothetical protein HPB51_001404 [Rhipicephalus microplus]|uniref:Uncharacterized protein n=1 Tax=Rhipicephalus microplus TaxID=6941 RepID=A0A9J6DL01_RHIMP|nr:hypothetical protein HPB51_001404 [Rhipicephalus microplus]